MPDAAFSVPRLADVYDAVDGPRADLDAYIAMVAEFEAGSVLDIGCGTGAFAVRLAALGVDVVAIDPADASLEVARGKAGAHAVRWVHGNASTLPEVQVDLATMTGNTAQVFLDDADWTTTLAATRRSLRPGGRLVFEARDPLARAWETWTPQHSRATVGTVHGPVESWVEVTAVDDPFVSFRWTFRFLRDGSALTSESTLRFRTREELIVSLGDNGFAVDEIRDAPDRPGLELVVIARRNGRAEG